MDLSAEANEVSESHSECMDEVTSAATSMLYNPPYGHGNQKTRMFRDRVEPTS
jgi:hypothetical protein